MPVLPGFVSVTKSYRKVLIHTEGLRRGSDVAVGAAVVDSGNGLARTSLIRAGNVIVKKTADGCYYLANDLSNGDRNTVASVSSATGITASWASSTLTFVVGGGASFVVTMASGDDTNAEVVTALNADLNFRGAGLIADVSSSAVRIRTLKAGADQFFTATSSYASAFGASTASATSQGTDADYRVLSPDGEVLDMLGLDGVAANVSAPTAISGAFVSANLLNTTPEALAVLARRGAFIG